MRPGRQGRQEHHDGRGNDPPAQVHVRFRVQWESDRVQGTVDLTLDPTPEPHLQSMSVAGSSLPERCQTRPPVGSRYDRQVGR